MQDQLSLTPEAFPNYNSAFVSYSPSSSDQYAYDANGSMSYDSDKRAYYKYNILGMPSTVSVPANLGTIDYKYSSTGERLEAYYKWHSGLSLDPLENVNRPTYTETNSSKLRQYVGNKVYENGLLKRILLDNGYIENGMYYFYLRDHLGNNCVVANSNGQVVQRNYYYPYGKTLGNGESSGQAVQPYKYGGKEYEAMLGLELYDFHARQMDSRAGSFLTVDPLAEKYPSVSPYVYCLNNPVRFIDPNGEDVYLAIWASDDGKVGHAGIAVDNYKTVEVKDKHGNTKIDRNGNPITKQVKDGTVTYYDLWPGGEGVGKSNVTEDVVGSYNSQVTTLDKLQNTDVTGSEGYAPDAVVRLNTDSKTDGIVSMALDAHKGAVPSYNGVSNNCSDYAKTGVEYAAPYGSILGNTDERIGARSVTTPNQLYKSTVKLPNASILKNPGQKINSGFVDAVSNGSAILRGIIRKKME